MLAAAVGVAGFVAPAQAAGEEQVVPQVSFATLGLRAGQPVFGFALRHTKAGAQVSQIFVGGPASQAGVQPGDLLVSVDGRPLAVKTQTELLATLATRTVATFQVRDARGGEREVRLQKAAPESFASGEKMVGVRAVDLALADLEMGKAPPDFLLPRNGQQIRLRTLAGKPVLVIFWATWCLPCTAELPVLRELFAKYHPRGVEFVGVTLDDDRRRMERFVKTEGIPWPQVFSEQGIDNPVAQAWGVAKLPVLVLIGRDGCTLEKAVPITGLKASLERALR